MYVRNLIYVFMYVCTYEDKIHVDIGSSILPMCILDGKIERDKVPIIPPFRNRTNK